LVKSVDDGRGHTHTPTHTHTYRGEIYARLSALVLRVKQGGRVSAGGERGDEVLCGLRDDPRDITRSPSRVVWCGVVRCGARLKGGDVLPVTAISSLFTARAWTPE